MKLLLAKLSFFFNYVTDYVITLLLHVCTNSTYCVVFSGTAPMADTPLHSAPVPEKLHITLLMASLRSFTASAGGTAIAVFELKSRRASLRSKSFLRASSVSRMQWTGFTVLSGSKASMILLASADTLDGARAIAFPAPTMALYAITASLNSWARTELTRCCMEQRLLPSVRLFILERTTEL